MKRTLRIALTLALALAVSTASAFASVVDASFNKINIEVNGVQTAVEGERPGITQRFCFEYSTVVVTKLTSPVRIS